MKTFIDYLNRTVTFPYPPKRIISLCPSITETLFDLGLGERIVGRTSFCIHPQEKVKGVKIIGGTKQVNLEKIDLLTPDLIIAEKEENPKELIETLAKKYPVFVFEVENIEDALKMVKDLGDMTDQSVLASKMVQEIELKFSNLPKAEKMKVAYIIWKDPLMSAGNHTFIYSVLERVGFENVFKDYPGRYPMVTIEDLKKESPDLVFLTSEPYPFNVKHQSEFKQILPHSKVVLVDGESFIWYGSRMIQSADYLTKLVGDISSS